MFYQGYGGGYLAEVEMVGNGIWVSGLAFWATDLLLNFFGVSLDFPACALFLVFDDLPVDEIEVSGKQVQRPLTIFNKPVDTVFCDRGNFDEAMKV